MLISGLQRTLAAAPVARGKFRGPEAQIPISRSPDFPIDLAGIGEGIPDSRFGQNRESGNARFPIRPESGNRETPIPDSAENGNRGPDGCGPGISWSGSAY